MPVAKTVRRKSSFRAWGPSGEEQRLNVLVNILDAGTFADPHAEMEGLQTLMTDEGYHVNYLEKGKYQIVATGEILTSNDPAAV